jgi:ribose transport system ATP-binding protein
MRERAGDTRGVVTMSSTARPILQLTGIEKHFGTTHALRRVDFTVGKGEIHGLAGANGAGKSTLMKIINGVYQPDAGQVLLDGKEVVFRSPRHAQAAGIGMVFQEFSLVRSLTVSQNVFLGSPLKQGGLLRLAEEKRQVEGLMKRLGVAIDPAALLGDLPVPHQQLTEIAKALSGDRRILVLDEPTASLGHHDAAQLMAVLRRLADEGLAIVFISHHLGEVLDLCDVVTVMRDGQVALRETTDRLTLDRLVSTMLGGSMVKRTLPAADTTGSTETLASVRGLHHGQKLRGVSFDIHAGEVIGVAGLLGSGRTELLECIAGLRRPSAGVIIDERNGKAPNTALVPEDRRTQGLVHQYSIRDNIALPILRRIARGPFVRDRKAAELSRAKITELSIKADTPATIVGDLSGGNQQKVVLAKSLALHADILLLDDPTFGIDIRTAKDIMRLAQDFAAAGGAVLWVSSEFDEIAQVSNRVLVLRHGEITQDLPNSAAQPLTEDQLLLAVQ